MQTRIRELRKRQNLTLQQLAEKVGTTAQTVQRLETANMTVSTDWLERFASAFGVRPAALLADGGSRAIPLLGRIGRDGSMFPENGREHPATISLDVSADDPVAICLDEPVGPYVAGSYLVGNRLAGADLVNAHGHDCIVRLESGMIQLRRLIHRDGKVTLVPLDPDGDVRFDIELSWAARVVLQVRFI